MELEITKEKNQDNIKLGINEIKRGFVGNTTCNGNSDENIGNTVQVFETLDEMCEAKDEKKHNAVPEMLEGDALRYYAENVNCFSYYI